MVSLDPVPGVDSVTQSHGDWRSLGSMLSRSVVQSIIVVGLNPVQGRML